MIPAQEMMGILQRLAANQILGASDHPRGAYVHPWQVAPQWDLTGQQWACKIQPGFVSQSTSAHAAAVSLPYDSAPSLSRRRISKPASSIDCYLTESPRWPLTNFRSIGPDGIPSDASTSGDAQSVKLIYEDVPPFFRKLGVGSPPNVQSTNSSGFLQANSGTIADNANTRLLRAVDIVLVQDRPATQAVTNTGSGLGGTFLTISVGAVINPSARAYPYLRQFAKYNPSTVTTDPFQRALSGWADPTNDQLKLATVYFLSPPGAGYGSPLGPDWQPYVKHDVFWNLNYALARPQPPLNIPPLTLQTGLAGGVGDVFNAAVLSAINDQTSAIAQLLTGTQIQGAFWSI